MVSVPSWQPSADDLAWMSRLLSAITDNGVWVVPCMFGIYRVSHSTATVELLAGDISSETHRRNVITFRKLGYACKVSPSLRGESI